MNEKEAVEKGLQFTGCYNFFKEVVRLRIEEDKKKYPNAKIYLVPVKGSKLSRGGAKDGYSAYACPKYFAYKMIESLGGSADVYGRFEKNIDQAKKIYDESVKKATENFEKEKEALQNAIKMINEVKTK